MSTPDWRSVRELYPVLKRWTYLNSATFGPVPRPAVEAVAAHFAGRDELASTDFLDWYERLDRIREKAARLIGAQPADIAFSPNAGTALSWLLRGIDWRAGDEAAAPEDEFPNNLYAPSLLDERGVRFRPIPVEEGRFDPGRFLDNIAPQTRLVILSSVNYSSGLRPPLEVIVPELKQRGVLVCVDGTQSVGALRFDMSAAPVDYLIVHGYKWLTSPAGAGFAYVAPEMRERLAPSVVSWRSHRDWRAVDQLHHGKPDLPDNAARYEGGIQNFSGLFAMEAVLDLMLGLGSDAIERRVLGLAAAARDTLRAAGGTLSADSCEYYQSQIVAASFEARDVSALAKKLKSRKILVAARKGRLRVSPHFFNNLEDIARLGAGISESSP